jgi:PleD family two-component response regulator
MNMVNMSGNDGFWARIRAALGRSDAHVPAYGQAAIATNPNKKPRLAQRVDEEMRRAWTYCAERNVSLCVVALEMDGYADYFAAYGRDATEDTVAAVEQVVSDLLPNDACHCLRSGRAGLTLVLPDMPALMARQLAGSIASGIRRAGLPNRESHAGHVTFSTGIAVVNPREKYDTTALAAAAQAVAKAQRRGLARLEITDLRGQPEKRRKAA